MKRGGVPSARRDVGIARGSIDAMREKVQSGLPKKLQVAGRATKKRQEFLALQETGKRPCFARAWLPLVAAGETLPCLFLIPNATRTAWKRHKMKQGF